MAPTIRDVAKKAQVSPATVSRYFSGSNVVGDELAKKIEESARELHYTPLFWFRICVWGISVRYYGKS